MLIIAKCDYTSERWGIDFYNEQGQLHRNDGPAVTLENGYQAWYQNGERHNENGPAIISKYYNYVKYFLNDKELTKEEFENWRILKDLQNAIKEELKS